MLYYGRANHQRSLTAPRGFTFRGRRARVVRKLRLSQGLWRVSLQLNFKIYKVLTTSLFLLIRSGLVDGDTDSGRWARQPTLASVLPSSFHAGYNIVDSSLCVCVFKP